MQQHGLLHALLIPLLAGGCTAPGTPQSAQPPAGAMTAGAAYPPVGAKWKVRVTERTLLHSTAEDKDITATSVTFNGRPGYGLASATTTKVLDPTNFNPIGTIKGGRVAVTETPDSGRFSWPLWIGKSWDGSNSYTDNLYGAAWGEAKSEAQVAAIEDVAVPAGTFKAFRIEYHGGIYSSVPGGVRNPGSPGFETRDTYWYAPGPKMIVKSEVVRSGSNYAWAGRTTMELLSLPR